MAKREMVITRFQSDLEKVINIVDFGWKAESLRFPIVCKDELECESVEMLDLTKRSENVLRHSGIHTVKDLINAWDSIGKLRGCGIGSIKEIKNRFLSFFYEQLSPSETERFWERFIELNYES